MYYMGLHFPTWVDVYCERFRVNLIENEPITIDTTYK